jgi:hypothetical protein
MLPILVLKLLPRLFTLEMDRPPFDVLSNFLRISIGFLADGIVVGLMVMVSIQ